MARGYSIHIGLDSMDPTHYEGWSGGFASCEADVRSLMEIAQIQKFASQLLLGRDATREALIRALERVAQLCYESDSVILSFAGAGAWLSLRADCARGERSWCLFDGQLSESELSELFARFRAGVRVLFVADASVATSALETAYHEMDQSRMLVSKRSRVAATPVFRALPAEIAARCSTSQRERYLAIAKRLPKRLPPIAASVQVLLACQENQLAQEGPEHGRFTAALIDVWSSGHFRGNLHDFTRAIAMRMPPTQSALIVQCGASDPHFGERGPFER